VKGSGRTGRRPGASGSREKIFAAARAEFALHGYAGATIRGIAKRAGCDTALVHHFFGTKERLFDETMAIPVRMHEHLPELLADPEHVGEAITRRFLEAWEAGSSRQVMQGLLRTAVAGERSAGRVSEMAMRDALIPMLEAIRVPDAEFRAGLVGSHMVGLMVVRHITRLPGVASASIDDLVSAVGPTIQRYIYGDIGRGEAEPTWPPGRAEPLWPPGSS